MVAYILNENVTDEELAAVRGGVQSVTVKVWPIPSQELPEDIEVAILIVRSNSTGLEEARVVNLVRAAIRIVCVYLDLIDSPSELSVKYCSSKVAIGSGNLGEAIGGNDNIQEAPDGSAAAKNTQKPHNC